MFTFSQSVLLFEINQDGKISALWFAKKTGAAPFLFTLI